jgi:hypothetical protein
MAMKTRYVTLLYFGFHDALDGCVFHQKNLKKPKQQRVGL